MLGRLSFAALAFVLGIALASFVPSAPRIARNLLGLATEPGAAPSTEAQDEQIRKGDADRSEAKAAVIRLTEEQIAEAQINVAAVEGGALVRRIVVPGTVVPDADRIVRVAVKLSGTVFELRKKIGDAVQKDEVLAILESREVADAKSEYLAARLTDELQQELFERDKVLWEKRVSNEQQFLRSRNQAAQARMRFNIARQKLFALGLDASEIAALPDQPESLLRRQEVRAPMAGWVAERKVDLGMAVGRDELETELFVIVDLDRVWVEMAVSPSDLPAVKAGQSVVITARAVRDMTEGKVVFINPLVDKDSRIARVVAGIANPGGVWRPGAFVTAAISIGEEPAALAIPVGAVQTIGNDKVVFARTAEGFAKRIVALGRDDGRLAEVLTGLQSGETIAVTNTFLLKSEMLKSSVDED
jgi:membrane fusion protein, heavy metal efflux system